MAIGPFSASCENVVKAMIEGLRLIEVDEVGNGRFALIFPPAWDQAFRSFKAYLLERVESASIRSSSAKNLLYDAHQHLEWIAETGTSPSDVRTSDLEAYQEWLQSRYRTNTVRRKISSLRHFYIFSKAHGLISSNPALFLETPRSAARASSSSHSHAQRFAKRLLKSPNRSTPKGVRDYAILTLVVIHGLRVGEIHRLNVRDVNINGAKNGAVRVPSRRDRQCIVPLHEETSQALKAWLAVRQLMRPDCDAVFTSLHWTTGRSEPRQRISPRGIRQAMDEYLNMIGAKRKGISCETLRYAASKEFQKA
jgi:site-specific recombinase XerD